MTPRLPTLALAGLLSVAGLRAFVGCVSTPSGPRFDPGAATVLDAAFAALCPLEGLAGVAAACPGEEAAFNAAVGGLTPPAPPPPPALVPLFRVGVPGERPLVHIGSVPAGMPELAAMRRRGLGIVGPVGRPVQGVDGGAK